MDRNAGWRHKTEVYTYGGFDQWRKNDSPKHTDYCMLVICLVVELFIQILGSTEYKVLIH
jgi:hypothetical protein